MSAFDALVSAVWSEARDDAGALLAAFGATAANGDAVDDAARAARALRLPHLEHAREALRLHVATFSGRGGARRGAAGGKDPEAAALAMGRAIDAVERSRHLEAVLALSEAIRFSSEREAQHAVYVRGQELLALGECEAGLRDLQAVKERLEAVAATSAGMSAADLAVYLGALLAMSSCCERLGDRVRAEAVLREAMAAIRDAGDRLDAASKKSHLDDVMGRLREVCGADRGGLAPSAGRLASSGLDALPGLLAGAHPSLRDASAALEERADAKRGRHLVATKHVPAGSALIVEEPFAWSLSLEAMTSHCLHCCAPVLASLPCPHCSTVVFCGPECRAAALAAYHAVECPVLVQLVPSAAGAGVAVGELSPMALLAFRIVVRAAGLRGEARRRGLHLPPDFARLHRGLDDEAEDKKRKRRARKAGGDNKALDGYGPVFAQVTHSESRTPADLLKRSLTAAFLTCCLEASLAADAEGAATTAATLGDDEAAVLTAAFLRHLQSCSCNAYQISEQRLPGGGVRGASGAELGGACYPTVSLVNHACRPNVARHSHGRVCVVRATRPLAPGDELLDNYGPSFLELDVEDRRAALAKQYMFQCECAACRHDWPALPTLPQHPEPLHAAPPSRGKAGRAGRRKREREQGGLADLADGLQASLRGLLEGGAAAAAPALQAALRYSAALEAVRPPQQPPCADQVRAEQVAALCWSLAGNRVYF